jgi:hypothetical protein
MPCLYQPKKQGYSKTGHPSVACLFNHFGVETGHALSETRRALSLRGQLPHKFLLIGQRAFAGNQFKIFMETGKIIKTAFIAKLLDAHIVFNQQLAGMSYTYLNQKLGISFSRPGFEITAK